MASVRAMIRRSRSRRVSTAAFTFSTISAAGITSLPAKCPQRLGKTWSSICSASAPARSSSSTVRTMFRGLPKPVSASTTSGPGNAARIAATCSASSVTRHQPDIGHAEKGVGDAGAGDIGGGEALVGDDARRQRIGDTRQQQRRAGAQHGAKLAAGHMACHRSILCSAVRARSFSPHAGWPIIVGAGEIRTSCSMAATAGMRTSGAGHGHPGSDARETTHGKNSADLRLRPL